MSLDYGLHNRVAQVPVTQSACEGHKYTFELLTFCLIILRTVMPPITATQKGAWPMPVSRTLGVRFLVFEKCKVIGNSGEHTGLVYGKMRAPRELGLDNFCFLQPVTVRVLLFFFFTFRVVGRKNAENIACLLAYVPATPWSLPPV
jgi:hypothetical protein